MDKASLHLGRGFDDSVPAVRSVERFRGLVRDGVLSGGDKDELQLEATLGGTTAMVVCPQSSMG